MFGFINDAIDSVQNTVDDFIEDPIATVAQQAVKSVTAPIVNSIDLVAGLTEGELRTKAAISLGVDVVAGMGTSELVEWYNIQS